MINGNERKLLFVCLGNICRSPLAEGLFLHLATQRGVADLFEIDSAGTGAWHAGNPADPRSLAVAHAHGIHLASIARQVDPDHDFTRFDLLLAMDQSNKTDLINLGAPPQKVLLMRQFDPALNHAEPHLLDVPDPYYGGGDGFQRMYDMLLQSCAGLLDQLAPR